jgi:hypothetical protein
MGGGWVYLFSTVQEDVSMTGGELNLSLDAEQEAEAQRIYQRLEAAFDQERMRMARLMASKGNHELFGATEYEVRDRVHELGARVLETAANERQKKGRVRGS